MALPLEGIVVADLTQNVAGPFCTQVLGDMGADVIKIERPGRGDDARAWAPPWWGDQSATFLAFNRNKRSVALDLKMSAGRSVLKRLVARVDVLVQSLSAEATRDLGVDFAGASAMNSRLVYCAITAFGTRGPLRDMPGYDPMMQAYGGLMSLLGEDGRPPVRVTVSIIDIATAMWAVIGILAALQERSQTGRGGFIDTSLYETTLAWMTLPISTYLANGEVPKRYGSGVEWIVPYQAFAAADGHIMVAAGNDNLFRRLCDAIGRSRLAEDPRFRTNSDRVVNREALIAILSDLFATQPLAMWAERLDAAGIPNGPIRTVDQVVADAQTAALGIIQQLRSISLLGLPLSFDGTRPPLTKLAPQLGEDNEELLEPTR